MTFMQSNGKMRTFKFHTDKQVYQGHVEDMKRQHTQINHVEDEYVEWPPSEFKTALHLLTMEANKLRFKRCKIVAHST